MGDAKQQAFRYQIFSSTDNPISNDTVLWRYLTFDKFAWLFEKAVLHHRRLDCLGDPFESAAMWKLYSREDAGVAVLTTPRRLGHAVDTSPHGTAMLGPVEYFDFTGDDMRLPFSKKAMPGFSKRKSFASEKEVRGIIRLNDLPDNPRELLSPERVWNLQQQLRKGIDATVDLNNHISEIVLSPLSKSWFDELVRTIAEKSGLGVRVRKSGLGGTPTF